MFETLLCADWAKEDKKRAIYLASTTNRIIHKVAGQRWSLASALDWTRAHAEGRTLIAFDLPLGVPDSFLSAVRTSAVWGQPASFLELLPPAASTDDFFVENRRPRDWRLTRPFFGGLSGKGSLHAYRAAARNHGVELRRSIEHQTRGKSVFLKSGIPGTVGSGAAALWSELAPMLEDERDFAVWPFEGDLAGCFDEQRLVIGEIYPRSAYATALMDAPVDKRPLMAIPKSKDAPRRRAVEQLLRMPWVQSSGVQLRDTDDAIANEDDFDALITAAALLRCVLEGLPLSPDPLHAPESEGGMLGTGSVNLKLREKEFG